MFLTCDVAKKVWDRDGRWLDITISIFCRISEICFYVCLINVSVKAFNPRGNVNDHYLDYLALYELCGVRLKRFS